MIKIDSIDHNGRGIAKLNNKIVFIENALPNEIVEITINNEKKNFIEASTKIIIKKSDKRIDSNCPYFIYCGGCDLLHLSYNDQLKFKKNKIENIIKKYMNLDINVKNIIKSDYNFNYRNKATFQVKGNIGFYRKRSYEIVYIDNCLLCNKIINNSIKYLKKLDLSKIDKIICRTGNNNLMIILESTDNSIDITPIKDIASSIYIKNNNNFKLVYGDKYIYEYFGKYKYIISPDSFFQINLNVCLKLYERIKESVGLNKNVLDLYCGTGSIGIFVNETNKVLGIEMNEQAILDANENKIINNLKNIDFICGDSGKNIQNLNFKPDIIIVDPPRSGLNRETLNNILKLNSNKIIYVSCDPMTLVRDLKILNKNYNINEITPFDMFPNTKHVETLSILNHK